MTERPCCTNPECRSLDITKRVRFKTGYRCDRCGETFAQPDTRVREVNDNRGGISAAGKALLAADPEDVP